MAKLTELEKRLSGDEPKFNGKSEQWKIAQAYNWYLTYRDPSQLKKYFLEFAKKQYGKKVLAALSSAKDYEFNTLGPLARMISNGLEPGKNSLNFIKKKVDSLSVRYKEKKTEKKEEISKPENPMTVQDYIREKAQEVIGDIEELLDKGIEKDYKFDPKFSGFLEARNVKKPSLQEIIKYYSKLKEEIEIALSGKDEQVKEAYAKLNKWQLKRYLEFVTLIIRESEERIKALSSVKKVRKKKVKTPEQLVKGMKISPKSVIPKEKIIGAQVLVVYNEKLRYLAIYYADSNHGLSAKGSSIINYDKTKSIGFTLRKPEQILPKINGITTRVLNNLVKDITTKKQTPNGRISEKVTLLTFIK